MIVTIHLTDKTTTNGDIPGGNITEVRKWLNSSNKFISIGDNQIINIDYVIKIRADKSKVLNEDNLKANTLVWYFGYKYLTGNRKGDEVELYTLESEFFKTVKTSEIALCTF